MLLTIVKKCKNDYIVYNNDKHMWNQMVCNYRNLNICIPVGEAWNFTNSNETCFKSHTKLRKYSSWPPLAPITTTHIKLKLRISILIAGRRTIAHS